MCLYICLSTVMILMMIEVDKDTAAKVISALRKAGYIGDEYSNYIIPVNSTSQLRCISDSDRTTILKSKSTLPLSGNVL